MTQRPNLDHIDSTLTLEPWKNPDLDEYLRLFKRIGQHWLWSSRLVMPRNQVEVILSQPKNQLFTAHDGSDLVGLIELDFRQSGQCEIGFFGLVPELNGLGHGRWLMNNALNLAWRDDIERVWLHTCTEDSPRALPFYIKNGFKPYKREVEIIPDLRVTGLHPITGSPHIPIIS